MVEGLWRKGVTNNQLPIIPHSAGRWNHLFLILKASVKICLSRDLSRDVVGCWKRMAVAGRCGLDQSSEERGYWPWMLRELEYNQVVHILTQENINSPPESSGGSGNFPPNIGWGLGPFLLDSKEKEVIKLMTSRFLLSMLTWLHRAMTTYLPIHPPLIYPFNQSSIQ